MTSQPCQRPTQWRRLVALLTLVVVALSIAVPRGSLAQDDELEGDYTVSINDEAVANDIANGAVLVGRWRISFGADGAYEAERLDLGVLVRGSYQVDGTRVTITDEEGLVSCSTQAMTPGEEGDVATGTYTFARAEDRLTMTVEEDACPTRRVLLTTTDLTNFVACTTEPVQLGATVSDDAATPEADEATTPEAEETAPEVTDEATEEVTEEATGEPTEEATEEAPAEATEEPTEEAIDRPAPGSSDPAPADTGDSTEEQIDGLLAQMTACWATGDPARFLALWSEDFRSSFLEDDEAVESLRIAMQVPTSWERASDIELDGETEAEVVVRERTLGEEEFVRFRFVREDGVWKWDGTAA